MDASDLELTVGHPGRKWDALKQRVQAEHVQLFNDAQDEWLDLLWCLDAYRAAGLCPTGMGNEKAVPAKRLAAVYRGKGNWFATLLTLLLENQTSHRLGARVQVQGFSQYHQIDVGWPARNLDPLICLETKVTGAPATASDPERGAMADFSNRRKELKFAATDLKLFRRQSLTAIRHWDLWRASTYPKCYFLWAARLKPGDRIDRMVTEAQALVKTYLEGAGIIAWEPADAGYVPVPVPAVERVTSVDDVLYRIATEITDIAPPGEEPPAPQLPDVPTLNLSAIAPDMTIETE